MKPTIKLYTPDSLDDNAKLAAEYRMAASENVELMKDFAHTDLEGWEDEYMTYKDHLETPRLTTRFVTEDDLQPWMEYCNDPVATTFTKRDETPGELGRRFIDFTQKRYAAGEYGLQTLVTKDTGEFVGLCGIMKQVVSGKVEIEVGYHLIRRYWGKGYASEAAQMFRDYGFENNVADSIVSIIHPLNERSKKVALRNSMKLVDTKAIFRDQEYNLFRITREEWEAMKRPQVNVTSPVSARSK